MSLRGVLVIQRCCLYIVTGRAQKMFARRFQGGVGKLIQMAHSNGSLRLCFLRWGLGVLMEQIGHDATVSPKIACFPCAMAEDIQARPLGVEHAGLRDVLSCQVQNSTIHHMINFAYAMTIEDRCSSASVHSSSTRWPALPSLSAWCA